MTQIMGLSIRQPWAGAIAAGLKPVENRSWATGYRGLIAIHASKSAGPRDELEYACELVADLAEVPVRVVDGWAQVRSAVIAVARLERVCLGQTVNCGCGDWAVVGQRHFVLADVRALAEPVPCSGRLGLWSLPDDVEKAVRAQVAGEAGAA